jgi:hypothetical protein
MYVCPGIWESAGCWAIPNTGSDVAFSDNYRYHPHITPGFREPAGYRAIPNTGSVWYSLSGYTTTTDITSWDYEIADGKVRQHYKSSLSLALLQVPLNPHKISIFRTLEVKRSTRLSSCHVYQVHEPRHITTGVNIETSKGIPTDEIPMNLISCLPSWLNGRFSGNHPNYSPS